MISVQSNIGAIEILCEYMNITQQKRTLNNGAQNNSKNNGVIVIETLSGYKSI